MVGFFAENLVDLFEELALTCTYRPRNVRARERETHTRINLMMSMSVYVEGNNRNQKKTSEGEREKGMRTNDVDEEKKKECLIFSLTTNQLHTTHTQPKKNEETAALFFSSFSLRACLYPSLQSARALFDVDGPTNRKNPCRREKENNSSSSSSS